MKKIAIALTLFSILFASCQSPTICTEGTEEGDIYKKVRGLPTEEEPETVTVTITVQ